MPCQLRRRSRFAFANQVAGCRIQAQLHVSHLARHHCGIGLMADANDDIERLCQQIDMLDAQVVLAFDFRIRSEEHTSELQSLMRISYAVFCLKKQNTKTDTQY